MRACFQPFTKLYERFVFAIYKGRNFNEILQRSFLRKESTPFLNFWKPSSEVHHSDAVEIDPTCLRVLLLDGGKDKIQVEAIYLNPGTLVRSSMQHCSTLNSHRSDGSCRYALFLQSWTSILLSVPSVSLTATSRIRLHRCRPHWDRRHRSRRLVP